MTLTSKKFVWWERVSTKLSLPELIELLNVRRVPLNLGGTSASNTTGPGGTPGLLMDLDPNELVGLFNDGDTVSRCPDATGNGNHATQSTSSQWPTFREAVLGQYPVLEFDSTNGDLLRTPEIQNPGASGGTIFLVARMNGAPIEHSTLVTLEEAGESRSSTRWLHVEESIFGDPPHDVLTWSDPATEILTQASQWFVLGLNIQSQSVMYPWVNGIKGTVINPHDDINTTALAFVLGGGTTVGGSGTANFQFARALWFDSAISDTEMAAESQALMNLYNIQTDGKSSMLNDDVAIANTETVVVRYVCPANTLTVGTTFRVFAYSTRAGTNTASPTYRVRIGSTTLTGNVAASLTGISSATAGDRYCVGEVTIRSIGSSGSVIGGMREGQDAVAAAVDALTSTVAVDTTASKYVELTFQSGHADNTYTFRVAGVELVRR